MLHQSWIIVSGSLVLMIHEIRSTVIVLSNLPSFGQCQQCPWILIRCSPPNVIDKISSSSSSVYSTLPSRGKSIINRRRISWPIRGQLNSLHMRIFQGIFVDVIDRILMIMNLHLQIKKRLTVPMTTAFIHWNIFVL
jgi:hypothetical protein